MIYQYFGYFAKVYQTWTLDIANSIFYRDDHWQQSELYYIMKNSLSKLDYLLAQNVFHSQTKLFNIDWTHVYWITILWLHYEIADNTTKSSNHALSYSYIVIAVE